MKYRPKRSPQIEAVQVTENFMIPVWVEDCFQRTFGSNVVAGVIENRVVFYGDYIVNDGEQIGVMSQDEFEMNFEPVEIL
jgi:hypothetical protein